MVYIVIMEKNGDAQGVNVSNFKEGELYKKCKFRKTNNFARRATWKWDHKYVTLFARDTGRAGTENKFDFPPPVDSALFFGAAALVGHVDKDLSDTNAMDLSPENWKKLYTKLMGGFEDIGDEDSYSDEEVIPPELQTKSGYMKDGFVVEDDEVDSPVVSSNSDSDKIESDDDETIDDSEAEYGKDSSAEDEEDEGSDDTSDNEDYDKDSESSDNTSDGSELVEENYDE